MNTLGHSKGDVAVAFGGDRLLRLPGPSPVPDRIVRAMAAPMIGHRSGPFRDMLREAANGLKALVGTTGDVHILAGSGTLAMESAVANLLEPDRTVSSLRPASSVSVGWSWSRLLGPSPD